MSQAATPPAYIVNQVVVHEPERYAKYAAMGRDAIVQYGGRLLAGGGMVETLEGEPIPTRVVIIEFPTRDAALAYYHSPEYQAAREMRGDAATVRFALVDGYAATA